MPTSVTGISTNRSSRRRRTPERGFSLLELLVVVVIIGTFVGVVLFSVDIAGDDRETEQEIGRLKSVVELVREEALMQGRDFGIMFSENSYRFYYYDYGRLEWVLPADDQLLGDHALREPLIFALSVEDREILLEAEPEPDPTDGPKPQVMILSTGEVTPFEAGVSRVAAETRYLLTAELDGTMEISSSEF